MSRSFHYWSLIPAALFIPLLPAAVSPEIKSLHVKIPMRDGIKLCANIFRPAGTVRVPVLLLRTPYGKGVDLLLAYRTFLDHGYAVIIQDVRGRYDSEGTFRPLVQEGADGDDTLNWIANQPWSTGKIGMMGGSYSGIAQWRAAEMENPHLRAIFPVVSGDDEYFDRFYSRGGAMKLGHRLLWLAENLHAPGTPLPDFDQFVHHLPLRTADRAAAGRTLEVFQQVLDHPAYDDFWKNLSIHVKIDHVHVPVYAVGGWYDNYVQSDLEAFSALFKHTHLNRLLVGPWPHSMSERFPGVNFGPDSSAPIRTIQLAWFDYWLKTPSEKVQPPDFVRQPPLRIFIMGANRWREARDWPIPRTVLTSFYLDSRGRANTLGGDGALSTKPASKDLADHFTYDPRNPVPTLGGAVCCNPKIFPWGPMDQRPVEKRPDVLVYTTPPLKKDLEVAGTVRVALYAATSAQDTDFTAKLVDVFPDGMARNLTDGILRLRYRDSLERAALAHPGEIYPLWIDTGVTGNVFKTGHRIRLEIASSNFPRFDRNPNTGRPVADETELRVARQEVHHSRKYPSRLVLPVIR